MTSLLDHIILCCPVVPGQSSTTLNGPRRTQIFFIVGHNRCSCAVTIRTDGNRVGCCTATVCTCAVGKRPSCKRVSRSGRGCCNSARGRITYRCCRTGNSRCSITRIACIVRARSSQRGHYFFRVGSNGYRTVPDSNICTRTRGIGECGIGGRACSPVVEAVSGFESGRRDGIGITKCDGICRTSNCSNV